MFKQIGAVGGNETSFVDSMLSAATTYTYRIRAYNMGGNSDYSNEASVTTYDGNPNLISNPEFDDGTNYWTFYGLDTL